MTPLFITIIAVLLALYAVMVSIIIVVRRGQLRENMEHDPDFSAPRFMSAVWLRESIWFAVFVFLTFVSLSIVWPVGTTDMFATPGARRLIVASVMTTFVVVYSVRAFMVARRKRMKKRSSYYGRSSSSINKGSSTEPPALNFSAAS